MYRAGGTDETAGTIQGARFSYGLFLQEKDAYLLQLERQGEAPKGTALFRPRAGA